MKWVKASERKPDALKDRHRLNVKYKGFADSIICIKGRWYWNNDTPTEYLINAESWSAIEWLDESTPPVSAEVCDCCGSTDNHIQCVCHKCRNKWMPQTPPVSAMEDGWVKAETPPETNERVLCLCDTGLRRVGYFYKNEWEQDGPYSSFKQDGYTVTHWHPLPPPPSK